MNRPQVENSELYNVLKIAWFATKDEQKYVYQMLVWHDQILKSWVPILNPWPNIFNFEWSILHSPSSYLKFLLSNLKSPSSTLLFPSSVKSTGYLTQKVLKKAWFPTKCPQAPLAPLAAFSRSDQDTLKFSEPNHLNLHYQIGFYVSKERERERGLFRDIV